MKLQPHEEDTTMLVEFTSAYFGSIQSSPFIFITCWWEWHGDMMTQVQSYEGHPEQRDWRTITRCWYQFSKLHDNSGITQSYHFYEYNTVLNDCCTKPQIYEIPCETTSWLINAHANLSKQFWLNVESLKLSSQSSKEEHHRLSPGMPEQVCLENSLAQASAPCIDSFEGHMAPLVDGFIGYGIDQTDILFSSVLMSTKAVLENETFERRTQSGDELEDVMYNIKENFLDVCSESETWVMDTSCLQPVKKHLWAHWRIQDSQSKAPITANPKRPSPSSVDPAVVIIDWTTSQTYFKLCLPSHYGWAGGNRKVDIGWVLHSPIDRYNLQNNTSPGHFFHWIGEQIEIRGNKYHFELWSR